MRDLVAKVGTREGRETLIMMRFRTEVEARGVWRVLDELSRGGKLHPEDYAITYICPQHGTELLLVLAAGTDFDAQIAAVSAACQERLDLNAVFRPMKAQDYEAHAHVARMARAGDN